MSAHDDRISCLNCFFFCGNPLIKIELLVHLFRSITFVRQNFLLISAEGMAGREKGNSKNIAQPPCYVIAIGIMSVHYVWNFILFRNENNRIVYELIQVAPK